VFSKADYELASRILGLPTPETPAEQAAAAPVVAEVLRKFARGEHPMPGFEQEGMYTGATRSLNGYPNNNEPMLDAKIASRMRTENEPPQDDMYLLELLNELDPEEAQAIIMILELLADQKQEHMDMLSSQRPAQYDTPNMGDNYSMLNAPSSNGIEPSRQYQQLS